MGGKRNAMLSSTPRMTESELKIVRYIVQKLAGAYCNGSGRPVLARSMNRVMEDVFGVKHFTRWMEKALRSQPEMVRLMNALDLNTIWNVTRSKQHYRMLATLVAIDNHIVKLHKKMDKIAASEPSIRPTKQYRKLANEAKQYEKRYKQCVKLMREIFDIRKGDGKGSLLEFATAWRDQMRPDNDYFSYFDTGYDTGRGAFGVDSMEDFLHESRPGKGAFGIFSDLDEGDYFSASGDMSGTGEDLSEALGGSGSPMDKLTQAISTLIDRKLADAGLATAQSAPGPYGLLDDDTEEEVGMDSITAILKQNAELVRQNTLLTQQVMGGGRPQPQVEHRIAPDLYMDEGFSSGPSYSLGDMMGTGDESPRPEPEAEPDATPEPVSETHET